MRLCGPQLAVTQSTGITRGGGNVRRTRFRPAGCAYSSLMSASSFGSSLGACFGAAMPHTIHTHIDPPAI